MVTRPARLVLGLGNPGDEYEGTRHNVGYAVLDRVARRLEVGFFRRGRALVARGELAGATYLLAKPTTYMNRSGRAARDLLRDLADPVELLVVCDDFNLPLGRLRCRAQGSAGGQKGLASVMEHVTDRAVARLRLGIGEPGRMPAEDYVLRPFKAAERDPAEDMIERAGQHLLGWLEDGDLERLMNAANAPPS